MIFRIFFKGFIDEKLTKNWTAQKIVRSPDLRALWYNALTLFFQFDPICFSYLERYVVGTNENSFASDAKKILRCLIIFVFRALRYKNLYALYALSYKGLDALRALWCETFYSLRELWYEVFYALCKFWDKPFFAAVWAKLMITGMMGRTALNERN